MDERPLTTKQFKFKENIIAGMTGLDAAREAKYKGNDNTLSAIASENLRKPKIKQAIEERRAEIKAKSEMTIEIWLQNVLAARDLCYRQANLPACAAYDRLIAQHLGALELDNSQKQAQLELNIKQEQAIIDAAIERSAGLAQRLQQAPSALAV